MGVPTYGHNFALADPTVTDFYSPTWGPGDAGPYTRQAGTLGFNEVQHFITDLSYANYDMIPVSSDLTMLVFIQICVDLQDGGWTVVLDQYYQAPYAYKGNQWIGYDDTDSVAVKVTQLGVIIFCFTKL